MAQLDFNGGVNNAPTDDNGDIERTNFRVSVVNAIMDKLRDKIPETSFTITNVHLFKGRVATIGSGYHPMGMIVLNTIYGVTQIKVSAYSNGYGVHEVMVDFSCDSSSTCIDCGDKIKPITTKVVNLVLKRLRRLRDDDE